MFTPFLLFLNAVSSYCERGSCFNKLRSHCRLRLLRGRSLLGLEVDDVVLKVFFFAYFRCVRLVWCTIRTLLVILNNLYCIPTYVCWLIILSPLESFNPELYHEIEGVLFHWLLSMVALWSYSAGYNGESGVFY